MRMGWSALLPGILLGALAGAAVAWAWWRGKLQALAARQALEAEQQRGQLEQRLAGLDEALKQRTEQNAQLRAEHKAALDAKVAEQASTSAELLRVSAELAREQQRGNGLQAKLQEQKAELDQLHARLTTEFENIANKLLADRGKALNDQQQERLGTLLKPLQERINSPSTQHWWHASTQTTRTGMRHMNGEIKTGSEAHRLFHQFFAELQRSGTFTVCKHRIRVLYLAVIRLLKISHTILHLQCAEGASTERSLELFRAYNYTPRIAELLAIRFKWAPVIFS